MTEEQLREIEARAEQCFQTVVEVAASGERAWRMSIPPQDDDADVVLSRLAREDVPALAAEVRRLRETPPVRLRAAAEKLHRALLDGHDVWVRDEQGAETDDLSAYMAGLLMDLRAALDGEEPIAW